MTTTNADQFTLDLGTTIVRPDHVAGATIQERFEEFDRLNPWVYDALETMTRRWIATGRRRAAIAMFTETLRWEYARRTTGDVFRISNDYRSRYARLLMERNPHWRADDNGREAVFATRDLTAP